MFDERSPIYQQIADTIKDEILSGALKEDEQVMSTNQYASFYRINPATAAKAFQQLVDDGILTKRRGIGMFVNIGARDKLIAERRARFFEEKIDPIAREANLIGIGVDEIVERLRAFKAEDGS
ncbi:MAG: GntR family transcriptional regulator [Bauldia sp.]